MAAAAAARAFQGLDRMLGAVDRLHPGDPRPVRVRAVDRVAAATVRRPVGQLRRDISRRYRPRTGASCRCDGAAPHRDVVVAARPPQPIIVPGHRMFSSLGRSPCRAIGHCPRKRERAIASQSNGASVEMATCDAFPSLDRSAPRIPRALHGGATSAFLRAIAKSGLPSTAPAMPPIVRHGDVFRNGDVSRLFAQLRFYRVNVR